MRCTACAAELIEGKAFCHACGTPVPRACGRCGAQVQPGFRFCPDCGAALEPEPPAAPPQPDPPATTPAQVLSTMPEGLADKLRALGGTLAGERKQVTVLFCDLAGSTAVADGLDPEVYREVLDQYVALALHEVYRFEGIVNQLSGDGFMALFGAPIAHEDAPQRGVHAALAIRDALAHFNHQLEAERGISLPARIGIHTGPVVVGTVGNDLKMDYTAIGDTTNLAARLESLATPGCILISETTARLVRGFFTLREVGPLTVKGKAEPVPACEVLAARDGLNPMVVAAERGLTPLVGRGEELAQLDGCYQRLTGHFPQVVAVVGDAGSGKSRLIYEFKERLRRGGDPIRFFEGRCAALSHNVPLSPFVSMLRDYFELRPGECENAAAAKVERRLGKGHREIEAAFPLLCRVLSVPAELPADLPLDALKQETFEAIHKLVANESQRAPVIMIVEDLHWIDEPSQELLEMAVARLARARVMVLVSHRPEHRPAWRTSAALTQLVLRPLLDDEVIEITRALAGGPLPVELERRILAKAEGSPFFAEEITRSLGEEGYLARDDGGTRVTRPVDEILIPGSVREVIAARLDRLGTAAKHVAQVAAVLGRQFRRSDLAQLLAPEEMDLDRELAELTRRGVIHRKSLFTDDEFRFGESLTQEVAYESLLLKQRRQLHERVAMLVEQGGGDPSLARPSLIAHHYALSENRAKAVETLLHAAAEAERLPSFRTALGLYRQAWELAEAGLRDRDAADPRFHRWLVDATLGYARLTVLYGTSADADAERAAVRGREMALQIDDRAAAATLRTMHGMLLCSVPERFAEGVAVCEQAVEDTRAIGDELHVISSSRSLVWHYMLDGRLADALALVDWLLAELERHGHRTASSDLYLATRWMRSGVLSYQDAFDAAMEEASHTYALAVQAPNRTVQSGAAAVLAQVEFGRANYTQARLWAERSLTTAEAIGSAAGVHRGLALSLAARAALGEPIPIARHAESIEEGLASGGNALLTVHVLIEALLTVGETVRADRFARIAEDRAAGRLRMLYAALAAGEAAVRRGAAQWADAERSFARALALAEAIGMRSARALALIGRGRLALVRNQLAAARDDWQEAHAICAALGLTRYERIADELLAQAGADAGPRAPVAVHAPAPISVAG
jgi:class 3 adenylate cyclase/tetratricopeptide (TPR) repeat protein